MPLTAHVVSWREKYINAPRPWTEFPNLVSVFAWLLSPFLFRADALCQRCQFVILAAFDHTDPNLPVEERVGLGLKRCGVSVTCESVLAGGLLYHTSALFWPSSRFVVLFWRFIVSFYQPRPTSLTPSCRWRRKWA